MGLSAAGLSVRFPPETDVRTAPAPMLCWTQTMEGVGMRGTIRVENFPGGVSITTKFKDSEPKDLFDFFEQTVTDFLRFETGPTWTATVKIEGA